MQLNTYLNFDGNCEAAFNYYAQHLGGKVVALLKFGESPMVAQTPARDHGKVLHARFEVDGCALMGTDRTSDYPWQPIHCAYVVINLNDAGKAERIFGALSEGGTIDMPLQETFWAQRYGITVDRFGVPWMVNCEKAA